MKLSIFYDHVKDAARQSGKSVEEILQESFAAGITAVDINNETLKNEPDFPAMLRRVGMTLSCSFQFYGWNGKEYGDLTVLKGQVDGAASLGAKNILVIPGFLPDDEAKTLNTLLDGIPIPDHPHIDPRLDAFMKGSEHITKMVEMLRLAVAYAKTKGITVSLEDFDGFNAPFARTLPLLWFMQNVEGLGFTFDTGNFIYSDERMEDAFTLLAPYLVHVHTKDRGEEAGCTGYRYKKGMAPAATGSGYLAIGEYAEKLVTSGYDGYFAIEHYGHSNQEEAILSSAEYLKSFDR